VYGYQKFKKNTSAVFFLRSEKFTGNLILMQFYILNPPYFSENDYGS